MGHSTITADSPVSDEVKAHPQVRQCQGGCGRWTRTGRMKAVDFPNTVVRGDDTNCQRCLNRAAVVEGELSQRANVAEERLAHTMKGLSSFLAGRRARGASPDGTDTERRELVSR